MIKTRTYRSYFEERITEDFMGVPVFYENVSEPDLSVLGESDKGWCNVIIRTNLGRWLTIGLNPIYRVAGVCSVRVFIQQFVGTKILNDLSDKLINKFTSARIDDSIPGMEIRTPYEQFIGKSENWFACDVMIPFHFDQQQ